MSIAATCPDCRGYTCICTNAGNQFEMLLPINQEVLALSLRNKALMDAIKAAAHALALPSNRVLSRQDALRRLVDIIEADEAGVDEVAAGISDDQRQGFLDGYEAAADTAKSFSVRVGDEDLDNTLNAGAQMVASVLSAWIEKYGKA